MRKAGLTRSRSRRKAAQNGPGTPAAPNDPSAAPSTDVGPGPSSSSAEARRKPTQEEAALTAKNYRLAKELSELRVRHRDETKTVTRLTMENMNLASRCREAISHVAMLKKELAMHQRRAAEALALQRQQSQRMTDHGGEGMAGSNSATGATEMDRMLPSTPSPPPPPPPKEQMVQPPQHQSHTPQDHQFSLERSAAFNEQESFSALSKRDSQGVSTTSTDPPHRQSRTLPVTQRPGFDAVSDNLGLRRKPTRMEAMSMKRGVYMDDVPADEMLYDRGSSGFSHDSLDFFSAKSTLPVTPEKETHDEKATPAFSAISEADKPFQTPPGGKLKGEAGNRANAVETPISPVFPTPNVLKDRNEMSTMSSIDAFEASFDTTFPASFSTPAEEPPPSLDIAFDVPEFSDPFFLGSLDGGGRNSSSPFLQPSTRNTSTGKDEISVREKERDENDRARQVTGSGRPSGNPRDGMPSSLGGEVIEEGAETSESSCGLAVDTPAVGSKSDADAAAAAAASNSPSLNLFPASAMSAFEKNFSEHQGESTPENSVGSSSQSNINFSGESFFRTPPVDPESFGGSSALEIPPPPREKAGAAEARARYDAALGEKAKGTIETSGIVASTRVKVDQQHQLQHSKAARDAAVSSGTKSELNHSPSLVLKRLHQRRAREKGSSPSPSSGVRSSPEEIDPISDSTDVKPSSSASEEMFLAARHPSDDEMGNTSSHRVDLMNGDYGPKIRKGNLNPHGGDSTATMKASLPGRVSSGKQRAEATRGRIGSVGKLSPDVMGEEMRQLDAIANASSSQVSAATSAPSCAATSTGPLSSRRRNVKQPVSYTEPALNTKLRRGDVFFPKKDAVSDTESKNGDENSSERVNPLAVPDPELSGEETTDLNHVRSTSAEDVLKDLAGKSTALKL